MGTARSDYSSLDYMLSMRELYTEKTKSFDEVIEKLSELGEKYKPENTRQLDEELRNKVQRIFQIVASTTHYLIYELNMIKNDKLLLEIEEYLSIERYKKMAFDTSLAIGFMSKTEKTTRRLYNAWLMWLGKFVKSVVIVTM